MADEQILGRGHYILKREFSEGSAHVLTVTFPALEQDAGDQLGQAANSLSPDKQANAQQQQQPVNREQVANEAHGSPSNGHAAAAELPQQPGKPGAVHAVRAEHAVHTKAKPNSQHPAGRDADEVSSHPWHQRKPVLLQGNSPMPVKSAGAYVTRPYYLMPAAKVLARESCGHSWLLQPKIANMESLEYR